MAVIAPAPLDLQSNISDAEKVELPTEMGDANNSKVKEFWDPEEKCTKVNDGFATYPKMTKKALKECCKKDKLYITPHLNNILYLLEEVWGKFEALFSQI